VSPRASRVSGVRYRDSDARLGSSLGVSRASVRARRPRAWDRRGTRRVERAEREARAEGAVESARPRRGIAATAAVDRRLERGLRIALASAARRGAGARSALTPDLATWTHDSKPALNLRSSRSRPTTVRGRCDTHIRRSGGGRSPGLCAHGAPLFAWIPAYAHCCPGKIGYPPSSLRRRPESVRPRGHHISAVQVRVEASHDLVVEGNCVAVRRGGEQPETNRRSVG